MKVHILKFDCITNLHVGSGDINYSIIDNEVEKDPVTGYPMIHASGVKGAFRDLVESNKANVELAKELAQKLFGGKGEASKLSSSAYKIFDAMMITRPLRVKGGNKPSIPVFTEQSINDYLRVLSMFGVNKYGVDSIKVDFKSVNFVTNVDAIQVKGEKIKKIQVEGEETEKISDQKLIGDLAKLKDIIGAEYAIAKSLDEFDLPTIARNKLDNGISKNLWYEEFVPYSSVFYCLVITPDEEFEIDLTNPIQFGGHASLGYGFVKVTDLSNQE